MIMVNIHVRGWSTIARAIQNEGNNRIPVLRSRVFYTALDSVLFGTITIDALRNINTSHLYRCPWARDLGGSSKTIAPKIFRKG